MRRNLASLVSAALLMAFASVSLIALWNHLDALRMDAIGSGASTVTIQVRDCASGPDEVFAGVSAVSQANDVSIFRVYDGLDDQGRTTRSLVGCFQWDTFPVDQLRLESGRVPQSPDGFLASYETGDDRQVGVLHDFGGGDPLVVRPVTAAMDSMPSVNGIYRIVSTKTYDTQVVLQSLAGVFGQSPDALLNVGTKSVRGIGLLLVIAGVISVLALAAYVLTIASAAVSRAPRIGVQKMLGWSTGAVVWDIVKVAFGSQLLSAAVEDVVIVLVVKPLGTTFPAVLVGVQLGLAILTLVVGSIAATLVSRGVSPVTSVKGGVSLKGPLFIGYGVKMAFAVMIVISFVAVSSSLSDIWQQWRLEAVWGEKGNDLYVLADSRLTNEEVENLSSGDHSYGNKYEDLYKMLNDEYGAVYVNANAPQEQVQAGIASPDLAACTVMNVNSNYLKRENVLSEDGSSLTVSEGEHGRVVAVPSTMGNDERRHVVDYFKWLFDSEYQSEKEQWNGSIEVVTYQGGRDFFSYNKRVQPDQANMVHDPVFNIVTDANATIVDKSAVAVMGPDASILMPITRERADELEAWLAQNGFSENHIRIDTLAHAYGELLSAMGAAVGSMLALLAAVLVLDGFASVLIARLLVLGSGRRYCVERLLGWGWLARYGTTVVAVAAVVAASLLVSLLFGVGPVAFVCLAVALAVDCAVFFLALGTLERVRSEALIKEV